MTTHRLPETTGRSHLAHPLTSPMQDSGLPNHRVRQHRLDNPVLH
ncbi:MAG: hypothetical protein N0C89_03840 [Candidatus Thiodiazotropha endolucinida]|nr:hypothetical protein [Candidatus Thiodiazotropha endolucinida]